ncbi:hypothetical protein GCM10010441_39270 [Kitasatospora paracochleata]|uniref:MinD-like ATPase involved in chromosome partitioning or flagellar assembly n=1 Tax=Kitasatospora paracochleata TaxID=58354 RepID=A0ABT1J930_9ACTN|nr:hypothetical protein [Kitasatospora paracochleata]MCP2313956.1 hypothetical protein [Kitasatospora paracochleata]
MALILVGSAKGAPGASTTALALASVWMRNSLLVEADENGGDLVFRHADSNGAPLNPDKGMLSLAVAARRGLSVPALWEHTQQLNGGLDVLVGLAGPEQAAPWTGLWLNLGRALAAMGDTDAIVDIGRIGPRSSGADLLNSASLVLLVARTHAEDLAAVRDRADTIARRLGAGGAPVGILLVAPKSEHARAAAGLGQLLLGAGIPAEVLGCIEEDPDGAAQLAGRKGGKVAKSKLLRSTRLIVTNIGGRYGLGWNNAAQHASTAGRATAAV